MSAQNRRGIDIQSIASSQALSGQLHGCTTATALSRVVPKTNIPVIDEYYKNYDTQGQIDQIKFATEFERLREKIHKYWHVKKTPEQECTKVKEKLEQLLGEGMEADQMTQL